MIRKLLRLSLLILAAMVLGALLLVGVYLFSKDRGHPIDASNFGPNPKLPTPTSNIVPTINPSTSKPWPAGVSPKAPPGFSVTRFAEGLKHPRWIYVLPNADILVAESMTIPPSGNSLESIVGRFFLSSDGSIGASSNTITLLRDANGDGVPELRKTFLSGLNQPFGMLLLGDKFYVGNTDSILRYTYKEGATQLDGPGEKILTLPAGGYNNHWTRNLVANKSGTKIYVTVGSASNIADHGFEEEIRRANVLEINPDGSGERIFASGLRNPVGLAWEPSSDVLWTVVNERDLLGEDLVPDYLTRVREGNYYGWPYSYFGSHVDVRVKPQRPDMVAKAIVPDYALGSHTASLGLAFGTSRAFPTRFQGGAFIGQHGSWNRAEFSGYKVIYVPFENGMPSGAPVDFLTGFLDDKTKGVAFGRPVGVAFDYTGALLVADDSGNIIWRITQSN